MELLNKADFKQRLEAELMGNILPFWMTHVVDEDNGGFYGALTNDLQIHNDVPRSAILCARILWTYAAAYRTFNRQVYLDNARRAYEYLTNIFWDHDAGGLFWLMDSHGQPVSDRKHHYAQAFGIYGLAEYYRATRDPRSLELAQMLFYLLEAHAYDNLNQGYIEGSSRAWKPLQDMRLSDKEINCRKSMNTMLHILEAYSNLLQVWDHADLKAQHRGLLEVFQQRIIDHNSGHFQLFFDDRWNTLPGPISYGHDIEGSWLLWEAAGLQADTALSTRILKSVNKMAAAVYQEGMDEDGSIFNEKKLDGGVDRTKTWWSQVEAMVGFYCAYERTGKVEYARAASRCWAYIEDKFVDRVHGDWFKQLHADGTPDDGVYKAGPWECPYHHSRGCMEMIRRLNPESS